MADFKDEFDDFWDVSKLVPKNKTKITTFSTRSKISEVVIEDKAVNTQTEYKDSHPQTFSKNERKLDFSAYKASAETGNFKSEHSYVPAYSHLIKKVTVKPSNDRYDFYDTYRKAALLYYDYKCPKSTFVPFYSYKPQYAHMTTDQKKYYFFWRDEIRHGRFIKTDRAYIYLAAYEILNLPEKIGKEEGLDMLIKLWKAYKDDFPAINTNFSVWIMDYCLIYGIPCPSEKLNDFLFDIISAAPFKEFYLSDLNSTGNGASALIAYLSDYDWRSSRYAKGDNSDRYRMHLENAMHRVFSLLLSKSSILSGNVTSFTRTAFPESLCTHSVKCILEVEYCSIAGSPELREAVTAALKYTENKLRACLGVKSRLAVKNLRDDLKAVIDRYFASEFERLKKEKERMNAPEYERLYDAPESTSSLADAIEIERASWKMTARLVEGTETDEDDVLHSSVFERAEDKTPCDSVDSGAEKNNDYSSNQPKTEEYTDADTYGLSSEEIEFLSCIYNKNVASAIAIAKKNGSLPDVFAERINDAFSDNFGDVVIESDGIGDYSIIEDYSREINEWLLKTVK